MVAIRASIWVVISSCAPAPVSPPPNSFSLIIDPKLLMPSQALFHQSEMIWLRFSASSAAWNGAAIHEATLPTQSRSRVRPVNRPLNQVEIWLPRFPVEVPRALTRLDPMAEMIPDQSMSGIALVRPVHRSENHCETAAFRSSAAPSAARNPFHTAERMPDQSMSTLLLVRLDHRSENHCDTAALRSSAAPSAARNPAHTADRMPGQSMSPRPLVRFDHRPEHHCETAALRSSAAPRAARNPSHTADRMSDQLMSVLVRPFHMSDHSCSRLTPFSAKICLISSHMRLRGSTTRFTTPMTTDTSPSQTACQSPARTPAQISRTPRMMSIAPEMIPVMAAQAIRTAPVRIDQAVENSRSISSSRVEMVSRMNAEASLRTASLSAHHCRQSAVCSSMKVLMAATASPRSCLILSQAAASRDPMSSMMARNVSEFL